LSKETLVNDQLYAQFFYFIIRLLQSSTCFEERRAHHQEVKLCIVTLCKWPSGAQVERERRYSKHVEDSNKRIIK